MGNQFIEEILDTYHHKKKDINLADIRSAISLKFPELSTQLTENAQNIEKRLQQIE